MKKEGKKRVEKGMCERGRQEGETHTHMRTRYVFCRSKI